MSARQRPAAAAPTLRRAAVASSAVVLDERQREAVQHRGPLLRVLGAPGTGTTTVVVEAVVDRVVRDGVAPDRVLVVGSSRTLAASLREQVTARLAATSTEPMARTMQSFGFGVLRQHAALAGLPPPRLLTGPEQDVVLRDLLRGHASGDVGGPHWPEAVREALRTRGFRAELRDLLMRAVERGLDAADLARLGERHRRPEWVAAASVLREYDEVTALSRPGAFDPAWILTAAADLLEDDEEARARVRGALTFVAVDDAQELTSAAARLLDLLAGPGVDLLLAGDPDAAVQTFRGADPRVLAMGWTRYGEGPTVVLGESHRQPAEIARVSARVSRRIGALAGGQQRDFSHRPGGLVDVHLLGATAQEAALVAAELRRAHLVDGTAWSDMAVIVRGQGRTSTLRRVLSAAGVPVAVPAAEVPVREEVAARPILALLEVAVDVAMGADDPLPADDAVDLVTSPLGGADAVALRRLRRGLRRAELTAGGGRPSDKLLVEALLDAERLDAFGEEAEGARRLAAALAAGVDAAAVVEHDGVRRFAGEVTAETVLWAIWEATGLGPVWQRRALAGGPGGVRADRDLDAVLALFDAAGRYVDRLPKAGPREFLEHVVAQDVPGDTLVARASADDAVALVTPQGAAGRQWRFVVVSGVQEGVWPDLRLRGSLLGSEHLVDLLAHRGTSYRAAQAAVRYDETRLFLVAVTRASERLLVTAVRNEEEQPSVYLDLVDPLRPSDGAEEVRRSSELPRAMSLPGAVAELRRIVAADSTSRADRQAAAAHLARLTAARVTGADPETWWANVVPTDERPLREPEQQVPVSPSKIDAFHRCELRWLLTSFGGEGPNIGAASLGTLVHEIAAELGDASVEELTREVEARWGRLGLPEGWLSERKQQQATSMVAKLAEYVASTEAKGWTPVGRELGLQVTVGRAGLSGRVDRLEQDDKGRLRVVDLKTGSASSKPSQAEVLTHPQLAAYQIAVEEGAFAQELGSGGAGASTAGAGVAAGAALLQLGKGANRSVTLQCQPPLAEYDDPGWAREVLRTVADGMAGGAFRAIVNKDCERCQVRMSCPAHPESHLL